MDPSVTEDKGRDGAVSASPLGSSATAAGEKEGEYTSSSYAYDEDGGSSYEGSSRSSLEDEEAEEEEQESLLSFTTVAIPFQLDGHHVMTVQAFQKILLMGTNQGTVAILTIPAARKPARQGEAGSARRQVGSVAASTTASTPQAQQRQPKLERLLQNHTDPISDVSCNAAETFVGASDKAGYVSVQNLSDAADVWRRQMEVPIQSLALHPTFELQDERPLVCTGADKVFLVTKLLFLSHRRHTVLAERNGKVVCVRWSLSGTFVAWLSERGLTIYSYEDRMVLRTIASPVVSAAPSQGAATLQQQHQQQQQQLRRLELYPPTLLWETLPSTSKEEDRNTLICGWGDWVQQIRVRKIAPRPVNLTVNGINSRVYRVESYTKSAMRPGATENPYRVCGIAPFGTDRYLVLACVVDSNTAEGTMRDLEVRVVHRFTLEDLYRGRMMVDYAHPLQLALACHHGRQAVAESTTPRAGGGGGATALDEPPQPPRSALYPPPDTIYYVLSVDSMVQATPCDEDDHVDYLLRTRHYRDAYNYAVRHTLRRHHAATIAQQMLTALLEEGDIAQVVALLPECVGVGDCAEWERWIFVFDQRGESWRLVDALPTRNGSQSVSSRKGGGGHPPGTGPQQQPQQPAKGTVLPDALHIGKEYYDLILLRALEHDPVLFNVAVHRFEGLFNVDVVAKAVEMRYQQYNGLLLGLPSSSGTESLPAAGGEEGGGIARETAAQRSAQDEPLKALSESYGGLLRLLGRNDDALQVLLKVDDSDELFHFIRRTRLFSKALELLPELFLRSRGRTVDLLLEHAPPPPGSQMPSPAAQGQQQGPTAFPPGSANDPLAPESVVRRLEQSHREELWLYLCALRKENKPAFTTVAKRNAQLVATLFIDYDRPQLLPFLKEMSMYLDRIKEVYALCRKQNLLDEVVFLMARMGKEEEGLRVLVQQVKNMHKAVAYITEVPTREDQVALFQKLVQLAIEANEQLPVNPADGQKYVLHDTQIGDTYASVAARYGVDETVIREANLGEGMRGNQSSGALSTSTPPGTPGSRVSSSFEAGGSALSSATRPRRRNMLRHYAAPISPLLPTTTTGSSPGGSNRSSRTNRLPRGSSRALDQMLRSHSSSSEQDATSPHQRGHQQQQQQRPPPRPCVVPLNLLSALLTAAADPSYADNPAIDANYLIKALPTEEPIPHVGVYIAAVTRSRADEEAFLGTILQATERDVAEDYGGLLRRRAAAIRVDPGATASINGGAGARGQGGRRGNRERAMGIGGPSSLPSSSSPSAGATACGLCGQRVPMPMPAAGGAPSKPGEGAAEVGGMVAFACHHVYHPRCVLTYLASEGFLSGSGEVSTVADLSNFFEHPERFVKPRSGAFHGASSTSHSTSRKWRGLHCRVCDMGGGGSVGSPATTMNAK